MVSFFVSLSFFQDQIFFSASSHKIETSNVKTISGPVRGFVLKTFESCVNSSIIN